jgi:nucleotide-binding universal stress UspA family protein
MFTSVMVPLDGSTFAEHALPFALHAAGRSGADMLLALVHVRHCPATTDRLLRSAVEEWEEKQREREREYLSRVAEQVGSMHGAPPATRLLEGEVATELGELVRTARVDLVVITTHGRAGMERAWLGSVTDALLRDLDVPVLVVRPTDPERSLTRDAADGYANVLIALDGSERAERAIEPALAIANPDARIALVRMAAPPSAVMSPYMPHSARITHDELERRKAESEEYLQALLRRYAGRTLDLHAVTVVDYHAARAILNYADEYNVDLIAMATHGRGPVKRLVLGSATDKVVRAAAMPVLVC